VSTIPVPGIGERIDASYAKLTPQERRVAGFILANLGDLAVYSATEVASHSGVSKATVSRLFRRLGFENSGAVREHVRAARGFGAPIAGGSASGHLERELANLTATIGSLDLAEPARLLAEARSVLIVGLRNSYPVALHLRQQLAQARRGVALAPQPGQSLGEELASLGRDDTVVLIGFRRRPEAFAHIAAGVRESGASLVLIGDAGARRHAASAHFIECPLDTGLPFDSYATAMSVVSLLAATVLARTGRAGRERIARIGASYAALAEIEAP
jgi:DNA-binding MurR/RpiR family transcriptional regulator